MSKIINILPNNGVKSILFINAYETVFGDASCGKIYDMQANDYITQIYESGDQFPVENMIDIGESGILAAIGGKLEVILPRSIVTSINESANSISVGNSITILDLGEEKITDMIEIVDAGNIVISTSNGRILSCSKEIISAYLTNNVKIYADVRNGFGISNSASTDFMYALYKTIAEINEDKEIEKWKFVSNASAIVNNQVIGEFVGPILHVNEDLGFWKQISWSETKPDNTSIVVSIRSGSSLEELLSSPWSFSFMSDVGESNPIIRNLNSITINGQYLQLKVRMNTNSNNITPIVSNVSVKYSTKQASYFFTTKFSFAKDSLPNNGILVANITEPQNTEVHIGLTGKNSNDWADYQIIDPEKLFTLTDQNMQNVKVGIKFVSYDTSMPEVSEFSLFIGGEKVKVLKV